MNHSAEIYESVVRLLNQKAAIAQHDPTAHDWVAYDPVVGFIAPVLWHLSRKHGLTLNIASEIGKLKFWTNIARYTVLRNRLKKNS